MKLYTIRTGVISTHNILKEVPTGWRVKTTYGTTIYKRITPGRYYDLSMTYATTDPEEAKRIAQDAQCELRSMLESSESSVVFLQ